MGAIGIVLTFALLTASVAAAQPVATSTQAEPQREATASLGHSFAKAVTQKTMTFIIGIGIYSAGAGGLGAGTALSAINTGFNFVVLTLNDYAWDVYWPNTNVSANTESFRAVSSLSRNTAKYLTFKPIVTAVNLATVYWWTGSVMVTAVTGTAASLVLPLTFYANNTLWDWYDWYTIRR